ncbi:calpain-A-like [Amphiura filiformis]|uniref:calpain-A-like n=1 Tax=Amphiura filiformis TaxID=82378 RepID=UPI003B2149CA
MGCASSAGPPTIQSAPTDAYNGDITGGAPPGIHITHGYGSEQINSHPDGHLVLSESYDSFQLTFQAVSGDGALFEDPDFPTNESSLVAKRDNCDINWLRPCDISSNPRMLVDGISRDDIIQGILADCWFLAPCAALACHKEHIGRVIPSKQPLSGPDYLGMVYFRFWRFGRWVEVVIDDRLPVKPNGQLLFAKSSDQDEFWPALLEKAYAKLHGGYQGLAGGMAMDAFVDLTSGLSETYDYSNGDTPQDLFGILFRGARTGAFMTCSRKNSKWWDVEADENGIVSGHSYTVTDVQVIQTSNGQYVQLLRIRNPWANDTEWNGDWSDTSELWDYVSDQEKAKLKLRLDTDGEFWMSLNDFLQQFNKVITCTVGPDFDGDGTADVTTRVGSIELLMVHGSWVEGVNAGGCANHKTYGINPQFVFTISQPDDFDPWRDPAMKHGKCSVVIALMQEYRRTRQNIKPIREKIGFTLYKTNTANQRVSQDWLKKNYGGIGNSGLYINHREVQLRCLLEPGHYVVLPTTFDPDKECSFILRIFSEKPIMCKSFASA